VTTTVRHLPTEVPLGPRDGLKRPSVVSLDDLTTIAKGHLSDRISVLSITKMRAVRAALIFALALDE
jgi:mRNA-degrading endonuclease toxin of MazEF toxin-antitoxin module